MNENLDNEIVIDSDNESVIVDDGIAQDVIVEDSTSSDTVDAGNVLVINRTAFTWLEYVIADWEQTSSYYKLAIPFSVHKCKNAYMSTMLVGSEADSGDEDDLLGFENNIATWKLLPNDSIIIKSDDPVDCKILIKGER